MNSNWQDLLPAPAIREAAGFIYASGIYPLEPDGTLARPRRVSPWTGESDAAVQMRTVLKVLQGALAAAGSNLGLVAKLEIQLVDAAVFPEVKLVLEEAFANPPAVTTIVVGDEHLVEGSLVSLSAVAISEGSGHVIERIRLDGEAHSLRSSEAASHAVKAGPFIFASGLTALDHRHGVAVVPSERAYHQSAAVLQAEYVVDTLEAVLTAGGARLDDLVKVQFYQPDLQTFPAVDSVWGARVGLPPTRSSMACRGLLAPDLVWSVSAQAVHPGSGLVKTESRAGIRWHPVDAGKANFTPGIRAGNWFFTAGQIPVPDIVTGDWVGAPAGLPNHWSDIELQTEFTVELLAEQLEANGLSLRDVIEAKVYLVDPRRDFRGFTRAWNRHFPADRPRPAISIIPSRQRDGRGGIMIDGPLLEVDLTSWSVAEDESGDLK